jgi:hypothetical protein
MIMIVRRGDADEIDRPAAAARSDRYGKALHPFACVRVPGPLPTADASVVGDFWIHAG